MDNFLENIKGCTIIDHQEGRKPVLMWLYAIFAAVALVAEFIGLMIVLLHEASIGWLLVAVGIALVTVVCIQEKRAQDNPECYTLLLTEELSAISLLWLQEYYKLEKGEGSNIWMAIPQKKVVKAPCCGKAVCCKPDHKK